MGKRVLPTAVPGKGKQGGRSQTSSRKQLPPVAGSTAASSAGFAAEMSASQTVFDVLQQEKQPEPGDEPWRCRRIARGVPKEDTNKPRTQDVANTELDTARLLSQRGNMAEVPDIPEENQLKRLLAKKAEWLYSPKDSLVLNAKRNTIQQMTVEQGKSQTWTLAGRLVCDINDRPPAHSVNIPTLPPHLLRQRMPVTRTEVTEQRIIENAARPPPAPPQFTLEAMAPPSAARSSLPLSARAPDGSRGERNSAFSGQGASSNSHRSRVLVETARAPLTAR